MIINKGINDRNRYELPDLIIIAVFNSQNVPENIPKQLVSRRCRCYRIPISLRCLELGLTADTVFSLSLSLSLFDTFMAADEISWTTLPSIARTCTQYHSPECRHRPGNTRISGEL